MNVAFIPVRGGSKSIPLKNIRNIAGHPLVYWTVKAAQECNNIDRIYISTDSDIIKETVMQFNLSKVEVISRSEETASDTASTESAMLEFAQNYQFDNIVLIQATSPLIEAQDLQRGFEIFLSDDTDSVLSVVRQKRFIWEVNNNGCVSSTNYDIYNRPRRQEFEGYLVENGAFYITGRNSLLKSQNRISGNIRYCEMDESTYFEIDEPADWIIIENQLLNREREKAKEKMKNIKMFLSDCDGCLTDGGMYYAEDGNELKKFSTLDGMGFKLLREKGIITGIITGEDRKLNKRRADKLNVDILKMGVKDKVATLRQLSAEYGIPMENIAYVGDDINDLEAVKMAGFGCSVSNGMKVVKDSADYVTKASGGNGAIREIIELLVD